MLARGSLDVQEIRLRGLDKSFQFMGAGLVLGRWGRGAWVEVVAMVLIQMAVIQRMLQMAMMAA